MAEDYTPTTEQVRFAFIDREDFEAQVGGFERPTDEGSGDAFDRWLAAHDREVRAQALRAVADELERLDDNPLIRPLVANSQGATAMHEYALATLRARADAEERGDQ